MKADSDAGLDNRTAHTAVHWAVQNGSHYEPVPGNFIICEQPFDENFHIFGVRWDDKTITAYLDEKAYFTFEINVYDSTEEFQEPFFLILNLAVGGYFTGVTEPDKIDGNFPHSVYVDWIRVYQKTGQEHFAGNIDRSIHGV